MHGFNKDNDRKILPRWRSFDKTLKLGELNSVSPARIHHRNTIDFLFTKKVDWEKNRTLGHASDFVGAALTLGKEKEATEAALFLLQSKQNVSPWAIELAKRTITNSGSVDQVTSLVELDETVLHQRVNTLRNLLRSEPRDPITWVELSLSYAMLGQGKQAERSMVVALQLATNNRFILRSAGRLWVHLDNPERAHDIVSRADITRYDPWLLAAEIAIGSLEGKTPKFVKAARRTINESRYSPNHISELASALATLELTAGNLKKAKRLFNQSLKHPTENSIAQAAWASRQHKSIKFITNHLEGWNAFEAGFWVHFQNSKWQDAVSQCKYWQNDQPFSSWPSVFGSYVTSVALEDHTAGVLFAKRGLIANPTDFTLLNSLAFSSINLGDMATARKTLSAIDSAKLADQEWLVLQATRGLLEYRTGNTDDGFRLYENARSKARKIKGEYGYKLLSMATVYHAIEEINSHSNRGDVVIADAFRNLKKVDDPIFKVLEDRLKMLVENSKGIMMPDRRG